MKIKYVGVKEDGETAFAHLSGVERWAHGDVNEVKDDVAKRMLEHPDVFAKDDGEAPKKEQTKVEDKPVSITVEGVVKKLGGLDKDVLHALAKELGVSVHHASGTDKVIAALQEAFPE